MDPHLLYWKSQGQSFLSRVRIWSDVLEPSSLFSSQAEIQKARTLFKSGEKLSEKDGHVWALSLSSVHADSGAVLPLVFRPPAFLPMAFPLVLGPLFPRVRNSRVQFFQFLLQIYSAGFNHANRNSSSEQRRRKMTSMDQRLLIAESGSFTWCAGALLQVMVQRFANSSIPFQIFYRTLLPIPLSALLASLNVFLVRREESETGIQVFDSNGNPVGISKAAAEKAVRDTALSRAVLFGTTAAVPNLLLLLLQRIKTLQKNPLLVTSMHVMNVAFVLGLMLPVSFSLFPQLGTIQKEKLEAELQAAAVDDQLFYHRGL